MSNAEHLIENAINTLEKNYNIYEAYNKFVNTHANQIMAKQEQVYLDTVWEMAKYVVYTYRMCIEENIAKVLDKH